MKRWAGIARFGSIGDNLIAASVLHPLKRMGYLVDVITTPPSHVVYLHNPNIDKLSVIGDTKRDLPQDGFAWQKWVEARGKEYDVFLHASHSCEARHALFRNSTEFWLPADYRRKLCAGSYLETVHDIIGMPYQFGPLFYASDEEKHYARLTKDKIGERCLAWVLAGSRIDKVYPYATIAIPRIIKEHDIPVVLIGAQTAKERSMAQAVKTAVEQTNSNRNGLYLLGDKDWPIRSVLSFVQACDLVVTPDTGPAWAVAMEAMPKVVMVSHASAENITKHWVNTTTLHADPERVPCWPCHRLQEEDSIELTCVLNKEKNGSACISDISVEVLVDAVAQAWKRTNVVQLSRQRGAVRIA